MPAVSKQQQRLFGLALSVKRGDTPRSEVSDDVLNIVDTMSEKEIEKYAGTGHTGLPTKKEEVEELIRQEVRNYVRPVIGEGRAFINAARKAKEEGKTEFEFNGKTYPVTIKEGVLNEMTDLEYVGDQLVNGVGEGFMSRNEFVKLVGKETKYDKNTLGKIYDAYLKLDGRNRVKLDMTRNMNKFLKKMGLKEGAVNEASGEFVVYIERDNGRKKLLHTKKSQRAANMFMTKNRDKILNKPSIRLIGSMSKDEWEKTEARFAENIKKSDMKTISKKEWDRKHKDFKGIVKGQPYMMYYDKDTQSTVYGPVNIKESVVNERKYVNQTGVKSALLREPQFSDLLSAKEQKWVRGNDVKIYKDRFGLIFTDGKMEMVFNILRPMSVIKPLGRVRGEIKKLYTQNESVNEGKYNFEDNPNMNRLMKGRKIKNVVYDAKHGFAIILDNGKFVAINGHAARPGNERELFEGVESVNEGMVNIEVDLFKNYNQRRPDKTVPMKIHDKTTLSKLLNHTTFKAMKDKYDYIELHYGDKFLGSAMAGTDNWEFKKGRGLSDTSFRESVNEAQKMKMSTSQMKQLHKAFDKASDADFKKAMFSVVKRDKFLKLISSFDKSSLQKLVDMKPNAPFSKAVQSYIDGKIKESVVNEAKSDLDYVVDTIKNAYGSMPIDKFTHHVANRTKYNINQLEKVYRAYRDLRARERDNTDLKKLFKSYGLKESVVSEKKVPKKGSPDYHQHKIAVDTVKNPRKSFMGGPSATEAEETLMDKFGYSKKEIERLKR